MKGSFHVWNQILSVLFDGMLPYADIILQVQRVGFQRKPSQPQLPQLSMLFLQYSILPSVWQAVPFYKSRLVEG